MPCHSWMAPPASSCLWAQLQPFLCGGPVDHSKEGDENRDHAGPALCSVPAQGLAQNKLITSSSEKRGCWWMSEKVIGMRLPSACPNGASFFWWLQDCPVGLWSLPMGHVRPCSFTLKCHPVPVGPFTTATQMGTIFGVYLITHSVLLKLY